MLHIWGRESGHCFLHPVDRLRQLELARHAVQQVMKSLPEGAERIPDQAFHTPRGRYIRDADPSRFRRVALQGMLDAYLGPST